jgi:hypothetical protein
MNGRDRKPAAFGFQRKTDQLRFQQKKARRGDRRAFQGETLRVIPLAPLLAGISSGH